jgi:hypothetical protein
MDAEGTLDDLYIEWLYKKAIGAIGIKNPSRTYWKLARQLYRWKFEWSVRNDDNRGEDGKCLRNDFIFDYDVQDLEVNWLAMDCSMLEMFVALADRAAFESSMEPGDWFWIFMENLGLKEHSDRNFDQDSTEAIDEACDRVINRKYQRNGAGGLFPLRNAERDQRKVELWYQLAAYLLEGRYRGS